MKFRERMIHHASPAYDRLERQTSGRERAEDRQRPPLNLPYIVLYGALILMCAVWIVGGLYVLAGWVRS
jgi:hypothetical protein